MEALVETKQENISEPPPVERLLAAVQSLRGEYFRRYAVEQSAPRVVADVLWGRLEDWVRSGGRTRHPRSLTRRDLRLLVQQQHDYNASDASIDKALQTLGENLTILGRPRAEFVVKEGRRKRFARPEEPLFDPDYCLFDVDGVEYLVTVVGPTGSDRGDRTRDSLYLLPRIKPVGVLRPAKQSTPVATPSAVFDKSRQRPDEGRWRSPEEGMPTETGYRWIFSQCTEFRFAFSAEEAYFLCGAELFVLEEFCERGWLSFDAMIGRYCVIPTQRKTFGPETHDDAESGMLLYGALFAWLMFRQPRRPVPWFLPVDHLHAKRARHDLLQTLDLDLQDDTVAAFAEPPHAPSTAALLLRIARKQEGLGRCDHAARVYAALAHVAGLLKDRELFSKADAQHQRMLGRLDDDDRLAMRSLLGQTLADLARDELIAVGWWTARSDDDDDVAF
jgi:hypothetical protein